MNRPHARLLAVCWSAAGALGWMTPPAAAASQNPPTIKDLEGQ